MINNENAGDLAATGEETQPCGDETAAVVGPTITHPGGAGKPPGGVFSLFCARVEVKSLTFQDKSGIPHLPFRYAVVTVQIKTPRPQAPKGFSWAHWVCIFSLS